MDSDIAVCFLSFLLISVIAASYSTADVTFRDVTAQAGVNNTAKAACVVFVDYDQDGYLDIYVGNSGRFPSAVGKPNLLYRNNGDGTFTDVAAEVGVDDKRQTYGASFGDFDNDGDLDLYVANDFGLNALYVNRGDGHFEDMAHACGVEGAIDIVGGEEVPNGYGVALADTDRDGYLDIYVVNLGGSNILYRNNGDGTFTDVTDQANVEGGKGVRGAGTAAIFGDVDNDGRQDLFAVNGYGEKSFFYLNSDSGFLDRTDKAGVGEFGDAQGAAFGDYDNDGDIDLYVTNFANNEDAPLPNVLYRNNGRGIFDDVTEEAGVGGEEYSMGVAFGDLDNDGYLDLYVVNNGEPNVLYRNNGDGTFTDITSAAGVGDDGLGANAALGDINNDGYLDIYVANSGLSSKDTGDPDVLYLNDGGTNHWLQVQLYGTVSNYSGIGARVKVSAGDLHQVREVSGGRGYAQDSLIASFGLGTHTLVDAVEVIWPSGIVQRIADIAVDQRIQVKEGADVAVQPQGRAMSTWGLTRHADEPVSEPVDHPTFLNALCQNYPNPFNPGTWIPYSLAQDGLVVIAIYNSSGQLVKELEQGYQTAGIHSSRGRSAYWDGRNGAGEYVSSGLYFYQIRSASFASVRKMVLLDSPGFPSR